jgi:hypothetical protein
LGRLERAAEESNDGVMFTGIKGGFGLETTWDGSSRFVFGCDLGVKTVTIFIVTFLPYYITYYFQLIFSLYYSVLSIHLIKQINLLNL